MRNVLCPFMHDARWHRTGMAISVQLCAVADGVFTLFTVAAVAATWPDLRRLGSLEHLVPAEPVEQIAG